MVDNDSLIKMFTKDIDGLVVGTSDTLKYDRVPTGIPPLDKLIGGGVPTKRMCIATGPSGSGKSFLASQAVRAFQEEGKLAAWIDTEMTYDEPWMKNCGVDTDKLLVMQTGNGTKAFSASRKLLQGGVGILVIDSLAAMTPEYILEEDDKNPLAWLARFLNHCLPLWMDDLKHGSSLFAINQTQASLGLQYLDQMPGGLRQIFMTHLLLSCRRGDWIKEGDKRMGFDMKITMKKTKVGGEHYDAVTVPFRMKGGIDVMEIYIREAIKQKVIKKSAAWYDVGEKKVQGMGGIKEYAKANPEWYEDLKTKVNIDAVQEDEDELGV